MAEPAFFRRTFRRLILLLRLGRPQAGECKVPGAAMFSWRNFGSIILRRLKLAEPSVGHCLEAFALLRRVFGAVFRLMSHFMAVETFPVFVQTCPFPLRLDPFFPGARRSAATISRSSSDKAFRSIATGDSAEPADAGAAGIVAA